MRPTDGRVITNPENAQSFSHAEIKQAADQMNPEALSGALDAWAAIAAAVTAAGKQFESAIQSAISEHWEGAAADAAVLGIREFTARVAELGESLGEQSAPLSAAGSAASRFKAAIPDVPDGASTSTSPEARNSQEEQARDDMVTYYIQPYGMTAPEIPTLPPPVHPAASGSGGSERPGAGTAPGGVPTVPGTSADSTGAGTKADETSSGQATPVNSGAQAAADGASAEAGADGASAETESPAAGDSADGAPAGAESGTPQATSPQTTAPAAPAATGAATAPASVSSTPSGLSNSPIWSAPTPSPASQVVPATVTPAAAHNGSVPIRSDVPASSGGAAAPNSPPPRPGVSVPAQPAAQSAPAPVSGAPGRTGMPGSSGYAGMAPQGVRGRGEGDGEHRSPRYLRTEEHAAELLGETERTVPPVIGAD